MTGFVAEKIPFLQNHWYFRKVCAVPNGLLKISPFCEGFPSWLALDNATALRLTGNSSWPVTKRLSSGSCSLPALPSSQRKHWEQMWAFPHHKCNSLALYHFIFARGSRKCIQKMNLTQVCFQSVSRVIASENKQELNSLASFFFLGYTSLSYKVKCFLLS